MSIDLESNKFFFDDLESANDFYFREGLTDGLPIVPPTEKRVIDMINASGKNPEEIIGLIAPNYGAATVEKIAINAVMAGCLPEYMPVITAAVKAITDERFNLHGVQCTTFGVSPLVIINGPVRNSIGVNCGMNLFGHGCRANATIGRTLRLLMQNIGGARPGEIDRSTLGHTGKFTYVIGENEEESPWQPFHVEKGFLREESTVTVFAAQAPHTIFDHKSRTAKGIVQNIGEGLSTVWKGFRYCLIGETVLVVGIEHAKKIAKDGWSKQDIRDFLFENVKRPFCELYSEEKEVDRLPLGMSKEIFCKTYNISDDQTLLPKFESPQSIIIIVAGGRAGGYSAAIPSWSGPPTGSAMVFKKIET